jgi:hypothetical protein
MYNKDSFKNPFWAENSGFMTGRDPLGVQNSSITTYGRLLPGMTNLTLRLRYYGLYLWLLSVYHKNNKEITESNLKDHYNFIRRAELIIAFIMRKSFPAELSVIGSDFTDKKESHVVDFGFYDIKLGADKNKDTAYKSVYWDYPSGALGQYYAGSLSALDLIKMEGKYFIIQPEGQKLAEAFASSFNEPQRLKFLDVIQSGRLTLDDIDMLGGFSINNIVVGSEEWNYYQKMLFNFDGLDFKDDAGIASSLRKETIVLYLNYMNDKEEEFNDRSFITRQYNLNLIQKHNEASFGWYYYYINEAFHIALETIFWSMLVHLDGKEEIVIKFVKEITDIIVSGSINQFVSSPEQMVLEVLNNKKENNLVVALEKLEVDVKSPSNNKSTITDAFNLMFVIYNLTKNRKEEIEEFEKKYKVWGKKGRVSENLYIYIHESLGMPYKEFVEESVKKILNDHINTAYRKMGNGESNLLKFIIEDGIISHIQTMIPRHTSPRLRTISNFMRDLSFIDNENNLTDHGAKLLKSISL